MARMGGHARQMLGMQPAARSLSMLAPAFSQLRRVRAFLQTSETCELIAVSKNCPDGGLLCAAAPASSYC